MSNRIQVNRIQSTFVLALVLCLNFVFHVSPAMAAEIDIFDAARAGDVSMIADYVHQGGDVNAINSGGYTPFILATYHGNDEAAAALVEAGADACASDRRGSNAYMGVAFKGYVHTAQWLLDHTTCNVNHQNNAGQTALMMAALFGQEDVIKLLLQHDADSQIVDDQGNTAESLAQGQGLNQIIKIIRFNLQ